MSRQIFISRDKQRLQKFINEAKEFDQVIRNPLLGIKPSPSSYFIKIPP